MKLKKWFAAVLCVIFVLTAFPLVPHAETYTKTLNGQYAQSDARSMLSMINEFRTGGTWYWNSDDTTKTTIAPGQLGALTYDYALERIAMLRAAEIAVYFSHTRPNGTRCFTCTYNGIQSYGENIAAGYPTLDSVFLAWREDSENYAGQGHRRNMLQASYKAVGIACFIYNGRKYWVQEFGFGNSGTAATSANNSATAVDIEVESDLIPKPEHPIEFTQQPKNVTANPGQTVTFSVRATNASSYQWFYHVPGEDDNLSWYGYNQNGGKSNTYTVTATEEMNGYTFFCEVWNEEIGWVCSEAAKLTVVPKAPTIIGHPSSVTTDLGAAAIFGVVADDAESYQWQYQRPGETAWYDVQNDGKSDIFIQTNVEKRHNGFLFRCKVSNGSASTYSNAAKLTVITTPPTINSQPSAVATTLGATATFKVVASNASSYQWQYQRPGETAWYDVQNNGKSATFSQTNVEKRHNGFLFRCKVTNGIGSAYSNTAKLTVITTAPTITGQPSSVTKDLGATATFKVTASNATSYQWQYQKPGNSTWYDVLDNGKSATLNQTNVAVRHNGFLFRCKVTNAIGSTYSNTAKLTVITTAPAITSHPSPVTQDLGKTATFTVAASNATSYQWQYQKPGNSTWYDVQNNGKSATFSQTNLEKRHNGFVFRCKVTNAVGSTYSNTAKLTVPSTAPTINGQPSSVQATLGSTATFKATSSTATSYQWQYQIPGSSTWNDVQNNGKSATFKQTNVEKRHNGYLFRCKVTNGIGSTYSSSAKLTVITTAPTITGQPSSVTTGLGTMASFKVTATNASSYQWQYQRPGESTWNDVQVNGKAATFNQTNVENRHNGFLFRCKVTNAVGSTYSNAAKLTVN